MAAVLRIAERMARRGQLTRPRMPGVFLTLLRNAEWWSTNFDLPPGPRRAGRAPAHLPPGAPGPRRARAVPRQRAVFEYYCGMGLQLQVNASSRRAPTRC